MILFAHKTEDITATSKVSMTMDDKARVLDFPTEERRNSAWDRLFAMSSTADLPKGMQLQEDLEAEPQPENPPSLLPLLPYEIHTNIAHRLRHIGDLISLSNTSRRLHAHLRDNNPLWYEFLKASDEHERQAREKDGNHPRNSNRFFPVPWIREASRYDSYNPMINYLKRIQTIRRGATLRCQVCLTSAGAMRLEIGGSYYGVYCEGCVGFKFYDEDKLKRVHDAFWDDVPSPPQLRLRPWVFARTLTGSFPPDRRPKSWILISDAHLILEALKQSSEDMQRAVDAIGVRNRELFRKNSQRNVYKDLIDTLQEIYEDDFQWFHCVKAPDAFVGHWRVRIEGLIKGGALQKIWVVSMANRGDADLVTRLKGIKDLYGSGKDGEEPLEGNSIEVLSSFAREIIEQNLGYSREVFNRETGEFEGVREAPILDRKVVEVWVREWFDGRCEEIKMSGGKEGKYWCLWCRPAVFGVQDRDEELQLDGVDTFERAKMAQHIFWKHHSKMGTSWGTNPPMRLCPTS